MNDQACERKRSHDAAHCSAAADLAAHGIRIPHHRPGEHRTACSKCEQAKVRHRDDALAVRHDPDGTMMWLCHRCGWKGCTRHQGRALEGDRPLLRPAAPTEPPKHSTGLSLAAEELWRACCRILPDSVATTYLKGRNCALPHPGSDLRFHPALRHPTGHVGPALVALVTGALTGAPLTLHRTWLTADGNDKAELDKPRLLWPGLSSKGGVIRLWPDEEVTLGLCGRRGRRNGTLGRGRLRARLGDG